MSGDMFKEGNVVEVVERTSPDVHWEVGDRCTVGPFGELIPHNPKDKMSICKNYYKFKLISKKSKPNGREEMGVTINATVAKVFSNTEEAMLVSKHLGKDIPENFISELDVRTYQTEILAEAKRRQAVIDEDANKTQYVYAE